MCVQCTKERSGQWSYVPLKTQTALRPDTSDAGQKGVVIQESEADIEAALIHAADGILDLRPGRDKFAQMHVRVYRLERKSAVN